MKVITCVGEDDACVSAEAGVDQEAARHGGGSMEAVGAADDLNGHLVLLRCEQGVLCVQD